MFSPQIVVLAHLVAFECSHAFAVLARGRRNEAPLGCQFPHLDGLVQTATDKLTAVW